MLAPSFFFFFTSLSINNSMSKPFKSQFDLMAEAYGNVNYNKQKLINEDTAGKTVIGYPPSEKAGEEDYEEPDGDLDSGEVDYDVTDVEDAEEAGFNPKQLDELEDIVHAILNKRDHEDRAAKHEDGEY